MRLATIIATASLALSLACPVTSLAQTYTVPNFHCSVHCGLPTDTHPCCTASPSTAVCQRTDSVPVVTFPGIPRVNSVILECDNCCKYKPDACAGNNANPAIDVCEFEDAVAFTEEISFSIAATLGVEFEFVKATLEAAMGISSTVVQTSTVTCRLEAKKCTKVTRTAFINYSLGRFMTITHTWNWTGAWQTWSGCDPQHGPCPIAGNTWIMGPSCAQATSSATGNKVTSKGCTMPKLVPCPDREPCQG